MGRLRIKRKDVVVPFRQTLAYRLLLLTASVIIFLIAIFQMMQSLYADNMTGFAVWGAIAALAAVASFFNIDRMKYVHVPPRTAKKMGRR